MVDSKEKCAVLVTGGRDFNNYQMLEKALDTVARKFEITILIEGAQRGADKLSERWAYEHWGLSMNDYLDPHPANWDLGKKAGPIRNSEMLKVLLQRPETRLVVAFPPGPKLAESGTMDMVRKATMNRVKVWKVGW